MELDEFHLKCRDIQNSSETNWWVSVSRHMAFKLYYILALITVCFLLVWCSGSFIYILSE